MKAKRFTALVLAFLMVIGFTITASAVVEIDGYIYNRLGNTKSIEITSITDELAQSDSISIPSSINNYTVVSIGSSAFSEKDNIQSLTLPKTILSVCDSAFYSMNSLKSVNIPRNLQILGANAFAYCSSLETVNFQTNQLNRISNFAFYGCSALDRVYLPQSVVSLDSYCFANCRSLRKIYIPSSVLSIDEYAFAYDTNLTIYGESGSSAEYFAKNHNITFEDTNVRNNDIIKLDNLISTVNYVLSIDTSVYTNQTVESLRDEYDKAYALQNDLFATDSEINAEYQSLLDTYYGLELTNMQTLKNAVIDAQKYINNEGSYTVNSINLLKQALNTANKLINSTLPSYSKVNDAINTINYTTNHLVYKSYVDLNDKISEIEKFINTEYYKYTEKSIDNLSTAYNSAKDFILEKHTNDEYISELNELSKELNSVQKLTLGDVNLDGKITTADAVLIQKGILSIIKLNERQKYTADFNLSGNISIVDVVMLQRHLLS